MLSIVTATNSPDKRELKLFLEVLNFGLLITGWGYGKDPRAYLIQHPRVTDEET